MEEKKQIKISLKTAIILIIVSILIVDASIILIIKFKLKKVKISNVRMPVKIDSIFNKVGILVTSGKEPTKYKLFDNYQDYKKFVSTIDEHARSNIDNYTNDLRIDYEKYKKEYNCTSKEFNEKVKIREEEYKKLMNKTVQAVKTELNKGNYTQDYFDKYNLLLVETCNSVGGMGGIERNLDLIDHSNYYNLDVCIKAVYYDYAVKPLFKLYFIKISKREMADQYLNIFVNGIKLYDPSVDFE